MELLQGIIGGTCGAAIISGGLGLLQFLLNRKDRKNGKTNDHEKALRYLMLYIIQERAKQHIREKTITLEERRSLHHWHELYHNALGGNGDADALMRQVDALTVVVDN